MGSKSRYLARRKARSKPKFRGNKGRKKSQRKSHLENKEETDSSVPIQTQTVQNIVENTPENVPRPPRPVTSHPRKIQTRSQTIAQNEQSQLEEDTKSAASDENSDTIGETLESTNEQRAQSVSNQVLLSEEEEEAQKNAPLLVISPNDDVPREEICDAGSEEAVIKRKPRTVRAKRCNVRDDVMRDSSADSIHDYYQHSDSSQENLIKSKARKFNEKSNRSFDRRNHSSSKNLTFDDLFNDPIVPNSTFPSAKKKPLSTKNGVVDLTKSKKPRKSEQWSPVPLAQMRGLRNETQHFRLRRNRKDVFSETAPVEERPLQTRKTIGDSTRTIVRGCAGSLVRAGEGNPTIVKEAAANRSLEFEEDSPSKTRTLVRASNKIHTRGRRKINIIIPEPEAKPKSPEVTCWEDLQEESAESSSSTSESETESDDEVLEQLVQSTKNAMTLQSFIKDVHAIIPPHIFNPDTYRT
ncbi:Oidioi.mRNA.OKI2018_I69.XSR.g13416.t1.cds [Oikopleura dioica]|uniref:Oidioi.mRNA.OKI2018_I69.XSR.g13416.t1.cds n=1 Tax=Oikopleura dioica TaxID=34765 RepID=A0ABN7SAJ4_OIKDI|nr:Oidioi.mRNA.OKI2018_I69.XSR.g13416.t1.cds [Oikopleura dioica]